MARQLRARFPGVTLRGQLRPSVKVELAVRVVVDIARCQADAYVALSSVSSRQRVSMSWLEALVARLCLHSILGSKRGPAGGYRLARGAELITLADIVRAVDDRPIVAEAQPKLHARLDAAAQLWSDASAHLWSRMQRISVASLVEQRRLAAESFECVARRPNLTLGLRHVAVAVTAP